MSRMVGMKLLLAVLLVAAASAQVAVPLPTSNATVDPSALPSTTVGVGGSWTRGDANAVSSDVNVGLHIGTGNWYSWSTISTPVAHVAAGSPALVSTFQTGGAYVAAQSASKRVSLVTIVQFGFTSVQGSSTVAPAFSGSLATPIKLWATRWYFTPYLKVGNATLTSAGSVASGILQPGAMFIYGFGGK